MIDIYNRAFAYGDGVFETCKVHEGDVPWWPRHRVRLQMGCETLGIGWEDVSARLDSGRDTILAEHPDADWLKLVVARASSGRGYKRTTTDAELYWAAGTMTPWAPRISIVEFVTNPNSNARLAGIKHLNRLPEVLASDCADPVNGNDVLTTDVDDRVVCASSSNFFAVIDGCIVTPSIETAGVRGIMREWVCEVDDVQIRALSRGLLMMASECFLTNAIRGIVSVDRIESRKLLAHTPVADRLRIRLGETEWA
ncbi:MAG: aminotransferase class IV [Pseudomonadota bacterium]